MLIKLETITKETVLINTDHITSIEVYAGDQIEIYLDKTGSKYRIQMSFDTFCEYYRGLIYAV